MILILRRRDKEEGHHMNTLVDLILELRVPLSNQRAKVLEYFAPAAAKTRLTTFLGCILRLLNSKLSCFLFSQFRWRRVFFFLSFVLQHLCYPWHQARNKPTNRTVT